MTEIDVTLTDYGLAVLCSYFMWSLLKAGGKSHRLTWLWVIFFTSIVVASLTGGTVHGFFLDESTFGYRLLWPATLLAIGITSAATWLLAGTVISNERHFKRWSLFAALVFLIYASVILFHAQTFKVVILNYLPPIVLLLCVAIQRYIQTKLNYFLLIAFGILISLIAAVVQQATLSIHPTYFNHNATYHLIQAFGLGVLFVGSKKMISSGRTYE